MITAIAKKSIQVEPSGHASDSTPAVIKSHQFGSFNGGAMPERIVELGEESFVGEACRRVGDQTFRRLAEAVGFAIFVCDDHQILYVNHAAEAITGYTRDELLKMNFKDVVHPTDRELWGNWRAIHQIATEGVAHREIKSVTKDGVARCLAVTVAPIWFGSEFARLVTAFDITESKRIEEQAQHLAMTDPLTGVGNYRKMLSELSSEIERSGRTGRSFALLLLDVDEFKQINDRYGHLEGNRALCRLASVARACCRAIDTVARYGGDEFSIILPETSADDAIVLASRIRKDLSTDWELPLSVSVGVVAFPQDGQTIEALVESADRQLYRLKSLRPHRRSRVPGRNSSHPQSDGPILVGRLESSKFNGEFHKR